jgi:hypothetical protein
MTASRTQHLIASSIILVVALIVGWLSFTQQPAEAFLFPRLISVFFMVLAAWNFVRAFLALSKVGEGLSAETALAIAPGLLVTLVYVFWAAKTVGFYASSTAAFFILYTLYDPEPLSNGRAWLKRVIVTTIFMAIIYALFTLLLKVQTPREHFL